MRRSRGVAVPASNSTTTAPTAWTAASPSSSTTTLSSRASTPTGVAATPVNTTRGAWRRGLVASAWRRGTTRSPGRSSQPVAEQLFADASGDLNRPFVVVQRFFADESGMRGGPPGQVVENPVNGRRSADFTLPDGNELYVNSRGASRHRDRRRARHCQGHTYAQTRRRRYGIPDPRRRLDRASRPSRSKGSARAVVWSRSRLVTGSVRGLAARSSMMCLGANRRKRASPGRRRASIVLISAWCRRRKPVGRRTRAPGSPRRRPARRSGLDDRRSPTLVSGRANILCRRSVAASSRRSRISLAPVRGRDQRPPSTDRAGRSWWRLAAPKPRERANLSVRADGGRGMRT
jgi:hypothetical protein